MWPWEHLAVGYLCYSLLAHAFGRGAPRGWPVVALALGTQFPDLVDKPLAWSVGVLPAGRTLAHSLFAALPIATLAVTTAWSLGRTRVGVAFAFGYLSHLPADAFYPALTGDAPTFGFLLWPVIPAEPAETGVGLVAKVRELLGDYALEVAHGELSAYVAMEFGLLGSVMLLWIYDGAPPLRSVWSRVLLGRPAEEPR